MSFWSWFSRTPPPPFFERLAPEQRPTFTEADRQFVRAALDRFEASGLTIWSELNRDLIVARALIDIFRWKADDAPQPSLRELFLALACETDSLPGYIADIGEQFPSLLSMDEDVAEELLEQHSCPIFVNASSINLINEDNSLDRIVRDLSAMGNLGVEQINYRSTGNGVITVYLEVEGTGACRFTIEDRKRPDMTPALGELNRVAKAKGLGQYVSVPDGNSDSETFIFANETALPKIIDLLELEPI